MSKPPLPHEKEQANKKKGKMDSLPHCRERSHGSLDRESIPEVVGQ
jgi:hypothetical protein